MAHGHIACAIFPGPLPDGFARLRTQGLQSIRFVGKYMYAVDAVHKIDFITAILIEVEGENRAKPRSVNDPPVHFPHPNPFAFQSV